MPKLKIMFLKLTFPSSYSSIFIYAQQVIIVQDFKLKIISP